MCIRDRSESLQKAAGAKMKSILSMLTSNPVLGALAGAVATAVLQSSSATTVMAIGFVSARLMTLRQAIAVIFGANIGTTMTAQLMAFKLSDYIWLIVFVGFIVWFAAKDERVKNIGCLLYTSYDIVDGAYLYNRCHLIAYRLAGENANERNLVTGTRFMNVRGMVPFEDRVASYVDRTGNHVLYRATPVFEGDDLVARGVHIEAESVEDGGAGVSFNVFAYNAQPGVEIDYATGESRLDGSLESQGAFDASQYAYVLNVKTKRFHKPDCPSVEDMKAANREGFDGSREEAEARGYVPCGRCNP